MQECLKCDRRGREERNLYGNGVVRQEVGEQHRCLSDLLN